MKKKINNETKTVRKLQQQFYEVTATLFEATRRSGSRNTQRGKKQHINK